MAFKLKSGTQVDTLELEIDKDLSELLTLLTLQFWKFACSCSSIFSPKQLKGPSWKILSSFPIVISTFPSMTNTKKSQGTPLFIITPSSGLLNSPSFKELIFTTL